MKWYIENCIDVTGCMVYRTPDFICGCGICASSIKDGVIVLAFPPLTRHRSSVKIGLYQKESVVMMKYGCYVGN